MNRVSLLAAGAALMVLGCQRSSGQATPPDAPLTRPLGRTEPRARLEELVMIQHEGGGAFQTKDIHVEPAVLEHSKVLVRGLATSHTVEAGKLAITSEALFVRVSLLFVEDGPQPQGVDLRGARLVSGGMVYTVARHAQLAEPRSLQLNMVSGDKQERTLYFELPESEVEAGLTLVLPAGAVGPAELKMGLL